MTIKPLLQSCRFYAMLLMLVTLIAPGKGVCKQDTASNTGTAQFIKIDQNTLRYIQKGEGKDVLLVHGLPGCIEDWDDIFDTLSEKYRVTAFDRPGHGYSSEDNVQATVGQNAETVIALIKKLSLHGVILVGHSYGGGTILRVATMDPDEVDAYVAIAAVSFPLGGPGFLFRMASIPYLGRALVWMTPAFVGKGMVRDGLKEAFDPNEEFLTEELIKSRQQIWLQTRVGVTLAREQVKMNAGVEKTATMYDRITKPLYIIQGADDRLVPADSAVKLQRVVKNSKLIMLENTGHMVQFVHPDRVIEVIDEAAGI